MPNNWLLKIRKGKWGRKEKKKTVTLIFLSRQMFVTFEALVFLQTDNKSEGTGQLLCLFLKLYLSMFPLKDRSNCRENMAESQITDNVVWIPFLLRTECALGEGTFSPKSHSEVRGHKYELLTKAV